MIVLGMVLLALAGAAIPLWILVGTNSADDRTSVGLTDWKPTDRHCPPGCRCRGSLPW